jgi:hypothetical protein
MTLGVLCDRCLAVCDHLQGDTELGHESVPQEGLGSDDAIIGGQGSGTLDGLEAGGHEVGRAHVVCTAEGLKGGATGAWRRFEGGPAAQEVAQERGILLVQPWLCSRLPNSRLSVPAAWTQTSCLASARSSPMNAANASCDTGFMSHLPECARVVPRDMPACVLRRHEREPQGWKRFILPAQHDLGTRRPGNTVSPGHARSAPASNALQTQSCRAQ